MVGLTIWKPNCNLAVGASNSTIKGTYTITQADIDAVKNTALATAKDPKSVTDISGTDERYAYGYPIDTNPRILVKTAAVGGTGKR
jgi:hypothetical protein